MSGLGLGTGQTGLGPSTKGFLLQSHTFQAFEGAVMFLSQCVNSAFQIGENKYMKKNLFKNDQKCINLVSARVGARQVGLGYSTH